MPRLDRHELAGGLGDAGLFIPIAVSLVTVNGLSATAAFGSAGLAYVATAMYFRVPVPVQPLKAFAAAAIALELEADVIAAGALLMSAAMALLALSGAADWLAGRFPLVLVRGIQASVALLLVKAGVELAQRGNWGGLPHVSAALSLALACAACGALFLLAGRRVPGSPLVLAQLPLTFGNSVVATAEAERRYFAQRAARVRPSRLAASIGGMNLLAGITQGLPLCHGAGGVTAHVKLGARSALATASVGVLYLCLALVFGASLPMLLQLLLPGALAGMLLYVAVQHALLAADLELLSDRLLAAGVGVVTLVSGNLGIGFAAGVVALGVRNLLTHGRPLRPKPDRAQVAARLG